MYLNQPWSCKMRYSTGTCMCGARWLFNSRCEFSLDCSSLSLNFRKLDQSALLKMITHKMNTLFSLIWCCKLLSTTSKHKEKTNPPLKWDFFKHQQKSNRFLPCKCPLSKHWWIIPVFIHMTLCHVITFRAATSRPYAVLTNKLERAYTNVNCSMDFTCSVNGSKKKNDDFSKIVWAVWTDLFLAVCVTLS